MLNGPLDFTLMARPALMLLQTLQCKAQPVVRQSAWEKYLEATRKIIPHQQIARFRKLVLETLVDV